MSFLEQSLQIVRARPADVYPQAGIQLLIALFFNTVLNFVFYLAIVFTHNYDAARIYLAISILLIGSTAIYITSVRPHVHKKAISLISDVELGKKAAQAVDAFVSIILSMIIWEFIFYKYRLLHHALTNLQSSDIFTVSFSTPRSSIIMFSWAWAALAQEIYVAIIHPQVERFVSNLRCRLLLRKYKDSVFGKKNRYTYRGGDCWVLEKIKGDVVAIVCFDPEGNLVITDARLSELKAK